MPIRSAVPRLADILEAIERVNGVIGGLSVDEFEADWAKRWLVERGIEIVSEASRHLSADLKARHPDIPWPKVAGIGNVLRHNYERVAAPLSWALVRNELPGLYRVCRDELGAKQARQPE